MEQLTDYLKSKLGMREPIDYSNLSEDEIVELFHNYMMGKYKSGNKGMADLFYVGITCDIQQNLFRHNISSYLLCARVASYEVASRIEQLLHDKYGVYIGKLGEDSAGRGGNDGSDGKPESNIVYLAQRDHPDFKD